MTDSMQPNYKVLDNPAVLQVLFHPRPDDPYRADKMSREDFQIPVDKDVYLGASCHIVDSGSPMVLFFHGNGEIVSDYDDFGSFYNELGLNFFVVDYRGYGSSTGSSSVTHMLNDCHTVFDYVLDFMKERKMSGPLCLMGRSLGSASVIELGAKRSDDVACLIVESGFAYAAPLLRILGVDPDLLGFKEEEGFSNLDKIKSFSKPCLIIHAEYDHIIPFSDGLALYEAVSSKDKTFFEVKGANHNDIFLRGMPDYMEYVKKICCKGLHKS